jgi:uncharacterized protein YfaS (alpha-2-macroglobulin family)
MTLTTWRVMAVATDEKMHFGNGDATFVTTKPLLANPLLPQFARPGDRFQAGRFCHQQYGAKRQPGSKRHRYRAAQAG